MNSENHKVRSGAPSAYYERTLCHMTPSARKNGREGLVNGHGKCKFAESWLDMLDLKEWLQPAEGNTKEAYCRMCKKRINIVSMGIKALRSHMRCASHKAAASRRERLLSVHHHNLVPSHYHRQPHLNLTLRRRPRLTLPPHFLLTSGWRWAAWQRCVRRCCGVSTQRRNTTL